MPTDFDIMLNPHKYGYIQCSHCNGYGSSLKEETDRCTKCGGLGLVKSADDDPEKNHSEEK